MNIFPDTIEIILNFIKARVADAKADGVVLGLSGGIDSAVTLSLAVSALGPDKVHGLVMPFNETDSINFAINHAQSLSVTTKKINISEIVSADKKPTFLVS